MENRLNELAKRIHQDNVERGFYDEKRELGTLLMLIVSEVSEALEADEVKLDDLMEDGIGCDSLDCVEIVIELEKEFDINIPDNEVDAAAGWTVSELCDYVEERLKERKK